MKIEIYIEHGAPLLVFPQLINSDKSVMGYSSQYGHTRNRRAYLRTLKAPQTRAEHGNAWELLHHYAATHLAS